MPEQFSELFIALADYAIRMGAAPMNAHPGCWEHQISPEWWVAVNGHAEPVACSHEPTVKGFHAYIEFNGWPWGVINPRGGAVVNDAVANEAALSAALLATREGT